MTKLTFWEGKMINLENERLISTSSIGINLSFLILHSQIMVDPIISIRFLLYIYEVNTVNHFNFEL